MNLKPPSVAGLTGINPSNIVAGKAICQRCCRQGVAVVTTSGLCQHCSTKAEAQRMGLHPVPHTPFM